MLVFSLMIGGWAAGDCALWYLCWRALAQARWRGLTRGLITTFTLLQLAYLAHAWTVAFTAGALGDPFPLVWHVAAYAWHFVAMPGWLGVWIAFPASRFVFAQLRTRLRRTAAGAAAGATAKAAQQKVAPKSTRSRREVLRAAVGAAPTVTGLGLTAVGLWSLDSFRIRRTVVGVPALPPGLDGLTIAHLTDVHIGRFLVDGMLERVADAVNALEADLILFTGDLNDLSAKSLQPGIDFVRRLRARHGIALIEGNHDAMPGADRFEKSMLDAGLPLLLDDSKTFWPRGTQAPPVQVFGVTWGELKYGRELNRSEVDTRYRVYSDEWNRIALSTALQQRRADAFPLLLAHHPHVFDAASAAGLPLTLSGHTHGGQLMLTRHIGAGPLRFRYWSGLYRRAQSQLFVANGVGNWFPFRLNAPQEIVHLTLQRDVVA